MDKLHVVTRPSKLQLARYKHIPQGGNLGDVPKRLRPLRFRDEAYFKVFTPNGASRRLKPDGFCPTLQASSGDTNRFIHPVHDREITLRERARLQTFPDTHEFAGSYESVKRQIGNAVPVELAAVLATALKKW